MKQKKIFFLLLPFMVSCTSIPIVKCQGTNLTSTQVSITASEKNIINNNDLSPQDIEERFGYRGKKEKDTDEDTYRMEHYYYSSMHDVLFVAYQNIKYITPVSTGLDEQDLQELEDYMLHNFYSGVIVDNPAEAYRPEYSDYLKIIRIYPDSIATFISGTNVDGCSSSHPENGFIDVYHAQKDNLYTSNSSKEPRINVLAHEYGHIFNYYNLHMEGNLTPYYYLQTRLGDSFSKIYPGKKLPSNDMSKYEIWPTEIEADDYVELFYKQFNPVNYIRQSLKNYPSVRYLYQNEQIKDKIMQQYEKTLNYEVALFEKPFVVASTCNSCKLEYYLDNFNTRVEKISKYSQRFIVLKAVKYQGLWYYQVVLSPLLLPNSQANLYQQVSTRTGLVRADYFQMVDESVYTFKDSETIINYVCGYSKLCKKDDITGFQVEGGFNFSYFLDLVSNDETLVSYDYVELRGQLISVSKNYFYSL